MPLDLSSKEAIKRIQLEDLINDAVERKDAKALQWLKEQANEDKVRKKSDGTEYIVKKSIVEIRPAYIKEYLGYKTDAKKNAEQAKKKKRDEKIERMNKLFEEAFKLINE